MIIENKVVQSFDTAYEQGGLSLLVDKVFAYNNKSTTVYPVPFKYCKACDCETPNIEDTCIACGQNVESKPKFYQAVLKEVKGNVLDHVYGKNNRLTIKERMGNDNATCPDCGENKWMILADESVAVSQGGKPYIECLSCGLTTHL